MGMMMLPPVVVSLPFKLIFFVLVDGWSLVAGSLVQSYGTVTASRSAGGKTAGPAAPGSGATPRAWQRMLSGRRLDLLDPSPLDIEIEDIAHGLARVARWNGQTHGDHIFSVAQHTLLVRGDRAPPQRRDRSQARRSRSSCTMLPNM